MTLHTRPSRMTNFVIIAGKGSKDSSCKGVFTNKPTPPVVKEASVWLRNAPRQGMRRMGSGDHLSAMPASTAMNGWTSVTIPWETSAMGLQRVPTTLMGNTVMGNAVSSMIQAFLKRVLHTRISLKTGEEEVSHRDQRSSTTKLDRYLLVGDVTQRISRSQTVAPLFNEIYAATKRGRQSRLSPDFKRGFRGTAI